MTGWGSILFDTGAVVAGIVEPRAEASRLPLLG